MNFHFQSIEFYTPFVNFFPKYFISSAIIDGIVSLIKFLVCSLLLYRNTIDFRILLNPATSLNLLVLNSF